MKARVLMIVRILRAAEPRICDMNTSMGFRHELAEFIPFRDLEACRRARAIPKGEITRHPNPEFRIRVVEDPAEFYSSFALDIVSRIVEARVVDSRGHDILHRAARNRARNQRPNQQTCDRSIAIGKVKDVGLFPPALLPRVQVHSFEAWVSHL